MEQWAPYQVTIVSTLHFNCLYIVLPKGEGSADKTAETAVRSGLTWFNVGISVGAVENRKLHQLHLLQAVFSLCLYVEKTRALSTWNSLYTLQPYRCKNLRTGVTSLQPLVSTGEKRSRKQKVSGWVSEWVSAQSLSHVQLFVTPWTVAHQAPLSMGSSRQERWSGLPFPSPEETKGATC